MQKHTITESVGSLQQSETKQPQTHRYIWLLSKLKKELDKTWNPCVGKHSEKKKKKTIKKPYQSH